MRAHQLSILLLVFATTMAGAATRRSEPITPPEPGFVDSGLHASDKGSYIRSVEGKLDTWGQMIKGLRERSETADEQDGKDMRQLASYLDTRVSDVSVDLEKIRQSDNNSFQPLVSRIQSKLGDMHARYAKYEAE